MKCKFWKKKIQVILESFQVWNSSSAWAKFHVRGRQESFPDTFLASSNLTSHKANHPLVTGSVEGCSSSEGEGGSTASFPALPRVSAHTRCLYKGRTTHLCRELGARSAGTSVRKKACAGDMQRKNKSWYSNSSMQWFDHAEMWQHQCSCVPVTTLRQTQKASNVLDKLDTVHNKQFESVMLGRSLLKCLWRVYTKQTEMAKCTTKALRACSPSVRKDGLLCLTLRRWERILPTDFVSISSKPCFQSMENFHKVVLINWCFSSLYAANYLPLHDFFFKLPSVPYYYWCIII